MKEGSLNKKLSQVIASISPRQVAGDAHVVLSGLSYDSRRVRPGDLFVALPGGRYDGHSFVDAAVSAGAAAVLVERAPEKEPGVPVVVVDDTRRAMAAVAAALYDHPASKLCLVGITGTNGKTTTAGLLESVLEAAGYRVGVIGTLGIRWAGRSEPSPMTTPESADLQRILHAMHRDGITHVVMEVSSHALALHRVDGLAFDAAVFTNLSQDHLDFHGTLEEYFQAKRRLFAHHLKDSHGPGDAVVNGDDPYGQRLQGELAPCTVYGCDSSKAAVRPRDLHLGPDGIQADLATPRGELSIRSPLIGRLNLYNILAAVGAACALNIPLEAVRRGIGSVSGVDGRLQRITTPFGFHVVVDYAHTPDAMEKALACVRELTRGRLWVVFGCGGDRDRTKRPLMGEVAGRLGDLVVVTSDNPRTESPEAIVRQIIPGVERTGKNAFSLDRGPVPPAGYAVEVDRRRAITAAVLAAEPEDVVFVGGKGHETYQILGTEVIAFDDREVVREGLEMRVGLASGAQAEGRS
ncbi:UDP-N-acetylmuramoylalanyl-D-glutamate--2,6-diaminopimelate ligase [Desulfacinum hydrothermale DSM 13146]|uniref:UDP-N-acetylmuramoyl-L-alanyl-D-glutamate--2,6-diaminopimelate ligase n=1 Tax=Desulfacinum hydrothermale DSM 13146 TaxID=1121390 RepID=A0A1W1XAS5_9BACT|nr:UDP-N-acetylmuramoyl-L-alanyl-D-glutamate--2,6-diaminopimelate ligase [Desulfacinum hydrothermale]SMC20950.1 UDP-N-acetylmuramoylalanyl-D-glutamate--2,6-diaminopimelate ligase [Desulfacinum hydrothermale DSM 13146]